MIRKRLILIAIYFLFTFFNPDYGSITRASATSLDELETYLPLILSRHPSSPTIFGVETTENDAPILELADQANTQWVRSALISWKDIEPEPPALPSGDPIYHWDTVNEQALHNASDLNLKLIVTVKFTPYWAQKIPGVSCGPIAEASLDHFARFMHDVVQRYGSAPYNIKYWEIGNEPDVDPSLVSPDSVFGCWGDQDDDYYGGGYYAEMLKRVYPAVKAVDPQANILIGGLLLNCDPTNPPPNQDCKPAKFLEGILLNQGAQYFDILSFHAGAYYYPDPITGIARNNDETHPYWAHRGGIVLGKVDYLREVLDAYNVDKPIMQSEGGLYCHPTTECDNRFIEHQADYVAWLYVRDWSVGLQGTIWYTLNNSYWLEGNMLENDYTPKPVYYAYQFITSELRYADYVRQVNDYPGLRIYEFFIPGKQIWVAWSADFLEHTITLSDQVLNIYDKYGNPITPTNNQITIISPVFIEFTP